MARSYYSRPTPAWQSTACRAAATSFLIIFILSYTLFPMAQQPLGGLGLLIFRGFAITHFRHTTLGRTPLNEWSARRKDLYPTTHNTHKRQISMPPAGFETTIPASERPQTHALDRAATGIGHIIFHTWLSTYSRKLFSKFAVPAEVWLGPRFISTP
jgi:hypothetical protein